VSYLLDTNVISEIRRDRDPHVRAWIAEVDDFELHLSVLTLGEIRKGIDLLHGRDPAKADVFAAWLADLRSHFAERILPIDERIAEEWGQLNAIAPRNTVDSLIAATGRVHKLTVVTRNTGDFAGCDVPLLNPWQPQGHD
jgi:predicted nucleic acid-binding protein